MTKKNHEKIPETLFSNFWLFATKVNFTDEKPVEEILKDLLNRGGVPSSPSHHIQRQCEMDAVKEGLANLDNGHFLAIHGMPGSGKSVLAAEVLRDPEITLKYFPDGVFWFRVGMLEPQKLLNRVKILLEKLNCPMVKQLYSVEKFSKKNCEKFVKIRSQLHISELFSI